MSFYPTTAPHDQVQQLQGGQSDRILGQDTMDELAKDTGGKAFYNGNGLSEAVARAINNGPHSIYSPSPTRRPP